MKAWFLDLASRFWAVPLLFAVGATVLGLGLTSLDESLDTSLHLPFLFAGGPEGARALLSAIITSMISFTGLVFSITVVVLQLTSSQFSPRVLRSFLGDRFNQATLGVFVATFVYALVVLRGVRGTAQVASFVPQIAVTTAFVLVLASVLVFLGYIHHIAQSIRVATVIDAIAKETRSLIDRRIPADGPAGTVHPVPPGAGRTVAASSTGVIQWIDDTALAGVASGEGGGKCLCVELLRSVGEFVALGAPLARVHGEGEIDEDRLQRSVHVGRERTMDEDVGFGLRQLVDIAERALSPGINDPPQPFSPSTSCMTWCAGSPRERCLRASSSPRTGGFSCTSPSPVSPTTSPSPSTRSSSGVGTTPASSAGWLWPSGTSRPPAGRSTGPWCWRLSPVTRAP